MAHTVLTVNGRTVLDQPLDEWQQRQPEELLQYLKPGIPPQLWMKLAMIAITDAALQNKHTAIHVTTTGDDCTIRVEQ